MAYSDFRLPDALQRFGLTNPQAIDLFAGLPPLPMSPAVAHLIDAFSPLSTMSGTEKSRSEWIIALLLGDLWMRYGGRVGLYSGHPLPGDPEVGLTGVCDFLLCRSPHTFFVTPPAVVVVEAKNESISGGMGQCLAQMVGAQRFNQQNGATVDPIYGCVTTGSVWRFCQLAGTVFTADRPEYRLPDADRILGIFAHMLGPIPAAAA